MHSGIRYRRYEYLSSTFVLFLFFFFVFITDGIAGNINGQCFRYGEDTIPPSLSPSLPLSSSQHPGLRPAPSTVIDVDKNLFDSYSAIYDKEIKPQGIIYLPLVLHLLSRLSLPSLSSDNYLVKIYNVYELHSQFGKIDRPDTMVNLQGWITRIVMAENDLKINIVDLANRQSM